MLPLSLPHDSNPLLNWRATRLKVLMVPLVHGTRYLRYLPGKSTYGMSQRYVK